MVNPVNSPAFWIRKKMILEEVRVCFSAMLSISGNWEEERQSDICLVRSPLADKIHWPYCSTVHIMGGSMQTRSVNQLVCVATIIILFPCNDAGIGNTSHCCHHLTAGKTGSFWLLKITYVKKRVIIFTLSQKVCLFVNKWKDQSQHIDPTNYTFLSAHSYLSNKSWGLWLLMMMMP